MELVAVFILLALLLNTPTLLAALNTITNPVSLLTAYVFAAPSLFLVLYLFTWRGIWVAALDSLRLTGVISLILAPLYWLATNNWQAGAAMFLSGTLALGVITTVFHQSLQQPPAPPPAEDDEDDDEDDEDDQPRSPPNLRPVA